MRNRNSFLFIRWISIALIFLSAILTVTQLVRYSRIRATFLPGQMIAGVPVGGLTPQQAAERLLTVYTATPVEVRYRDSVFQIKPSTVDFRLNLEAMMTAADLERLQQPFWPGFWEFLWNRLPTPKPVPLIATFSEERLRAFLQEEIVARYDEPPKPAMPLPGSVSFQPGQAGTSLDVERAVVLIGDALRSPTSRQVNLSFNRVNAPRPSVDNLKILLQQIVELSGFKGTLEMYVNDLQSGEEIHFAYSEGKLVQPNIAFSAASTIKIPIMVSAMIRSPEPVPDDIAEQISLMIEYSENGPADRLMEMLLDRNTGPLMVTADMQTLGLENTFLAGYFYPGAPLLQRFTTPANQRTDVSTDPDLYNQTTASDIGSLLEDIYMCAEKNGGTFAALFPNQLTQTKCKQMVAYLLKNRNGVLLEAGIPEGTQIAHKHGWTIETDNLMHSVSDAGIVYTPGGNFIITIYMHDPVQLLWEPANRVVADLARAIYNYFNLPTS